MTSPRPEHPVLLVDDEATWLASFKTVLRFAGVGNVQTCDDPGRVLGLLAERPYSLLLMDIVMPRLRGTDLLPRVREAHPELPVIMLSGLNEVDTAVACIKAGAYDYFVKTTERDALVAAVKRALELTETRAHAALLRSLLFSDRLKRPEVFAGIVTHDPKMLAAFRYMEALGPTNLPLLVTGETGTGKELAVRAVHELSGREGEFVAVNLAGLDDTMFTDTLFGHRKGAWTGALGAREGLVARAAGGTLFLDEIGDLGPGAQVKLLRLLQEGEYLPLGEDVPRLSTARVVAATQADLEERLHDGRFRADLFWRLGAHRVHLPPLRERAGDIPALVAHFVRTAAAELGKNPPPVPPETLERLARQLFPGNVRELRALVYDAMVGFERGWLRLKLDGPAAAPEPAAAAEGPGLFSGVERLPTAREAYDALVREALARCGGNRTQAAELIGVTRQALARHLKRGD
ncbi:MAG: sigma-54-dependent transcriptional regulator [Desulfovibrionaceae bacterium]